MLQLLWQQTADFNLDARQVTHQDWQLFFARQGQQRAATHDGKLGRKCFQQQHLLSLLAELIAPVGFHALCNAHQQVAAAFRLRHFETQAVRDFPLIGNGLQANARGAFQHRVGDGIGLDNPVKFVIGFVFGVFGQRQQPGLHHTPKLALMHRHRGSHMQDVLRLAQFIGDNAGGHRRDFGIEKARNIHRTQHLAASSWSSALRDEACGQFEGHGAGLLRNSQRLGLHGSDQFVLVVAHVELVAGAGVQTQRGDKARGLGTDITVIHRHSLFKLGRVDRVAKAHAKHGAAKIGLNWVLIKLCAVKLSAELRRGELQATVLEVYVGSQCLTAQLDFVFLSHRPIGCG